MSTRASRESKALLSSSDRRGRPSSDDGGRRRNGAGRAGRASAAPGIVALFVVSLAVPFGLAACFGAEFTFTASTVGSGGSAGQGGMGGGDGGGGGTPIECVPSQSADPIPETCGIHVSATLGVDGNPGTRLKPYRTLTEAIAKAAGERIYVCGQVFEEAVEVPAGVVIYGALNCDNGWKYEAANPTHLIPAADLVPIKFLAGGDGIVLQDFVVRAADASIPGGSSIAAIADVVPLELTRVVLQAGQGKAGQPGETPTTSVGPTDSNDDAIKGHPGTDACLAPDQQLGGSAKMNDLCPPPAGPVGGSGGNGEVTNGSDGKAIPADVHTAVGGMGQPAVDPMSLWSCVVGAGAIGNNGGPGPSGLGAQGVMSLGAISLGGYVGVPGQPGGVGLPGQGGGGGGGAKGKLLCAGASGGGGGVGGCGGNGGSGGGAGGASIALISLGGGRGFDSVVLRTSSGGKGGDGGEGQVGGSGGLGGVGGFGNMTLNACRGGDGGQGGFGGKGGGGRGGHSIGMAYLGDAPTPLNGVTFEIGMAGLGGAGGVGNGGDTGITGNTQMF